MKKWNLVIDVAKCFNCNGLHPRLPRRVSRQRVSRATRRRCPSTASRWIDIRPARERASCRWSRSRYLPVTCNHCDDAPCLKAAKDGAIVKRADGIVIIVPEKAQGPAAAGRRLSLRRHPWNEEKQLPQAWPFDAHLLDQGWTRTRGSQVCPTQAMRTVHVEDDEMQRIVAEEGLEVLHPEYGTRPRVYYRNLDRFYKVFVGGSLAGEIGGVTECIEGARVGAGKGRQEARRGPQRCLRRLQVPAASTKAAAPTGSRSATRASRRRQIPARAEGERLPRDDFP